MEIIYMSTKEALYGEVIGQVAAGKLTQKQAGESLGLSLRQIKRLCKCYRREGLKGLVHKNRGKNSSRKIKPSARKQVLGLIKDHYWDFGPQLIKEQLEERNQLIFSREWIRRAMIEEGLWKVKKRKHRRYYQRRQRRAREGELLQIDGSPEYWFEDRAQRCCLISMVDDATSKIQELQFVENENLETYFACMKRYIQRKGCPLAVYSDRHTIFKSPKSETKGTLSQFGRAMKELNIDLIYANSPQAKGRVERSHGTLQDRLIKLMRLEGISTIEAGNRYLKRFKEDYNRRFSQPAYNNQHAHRLVPAGKEIDRVLIRKENRKVSKSMEVHYNNRSYQLETGKRARHLAGKTVQVLENPEGVTIEYNGIACEYKIYEELPAQNRVMDRKNMHAFLDKKEPLSMIQRRRKGIGVNF